MKSVDELWVSQVPGAGCKVLMLSIIPWSRVPWLKGDQNAAVIRANCPNNQRAITLVYCDIGICFMANIERFNMAANRNIATHRDRM